MTKKKFDKKIKQKFSSILYDYGFMADESKLCTFYRKASNGMFHFIMPDIGTKGAWYDIKVFPTSPTLDPFFEESFPDSIGNPCASYSYLSSNGVGLDQETFNCKTEENFDKVFENKVKFCLVDHAVPYLNQFNDIGSMIDIIQNPIVKGFALHSVGRLDEAFPILDQERKKLESFEPNDRKVILVLKKIKEILK